MFLLYRFCAPFLLPQRWPSRAEHDKRYKDLASRFIQNFAKFTDGTPQEVVEAGPRI